ncbi:AAA family ATPase [Pantoea septica]|uniref:AAA family ATPase n=1 Tax=Pantoea septica TaxID=472695 RepID=UPI000535673E|nr:AAA family ATPase [Pantoea septica]MBU5379173.1 AAA family ATPase [Pantoea septica]MDU5837262.1 AAA family ATPase [Pantoea sp.]HAT25000.1 ParA family protein [Pantoea septica]
MKSNYGGVDETARRANAMLRSMSDDIIDKRHEFGLDQYYQTFTRNSVANLPKLSRRAVEQAIDEMESKGHVFGKKDAGNTKHYALTVQDVVDIYAHRKVPKYRDIHKGEGPFVIFVVNLKGGVSKTVSTVTLAHGLRVHPDLLQYDLRNLVIDLDPQASSTMFLNHANSIGSIMETAAQAMLNDLDAEQLHKEIIQPTIIPGVDIIPASIDDGFVASQWNDLVREHLPGVLPSEVLRRNIIDRVGDDYDFIFIDTGPHLDAFMLNAIAASDLLLTPTPPAQVDFHSTLKYLTRLPEMLEQLEEEGINPRIKGNIGFMSKMTSKRDHEMTHGLARDVFTSYILDAALPRLDGFERCGETFDTIVSADPQSYPGSTEALKNAKREAERFTQAVFKRIEFVRSSQS